MPFWAALAAGLRRSSIIRAGEGRRDGAARCAGCSACQGAEEIHGGKIQALPPLLFLRRAPFRGCAAESRSPPALLPSRSKCRFPGERLEICTMKSAQPKHLQGSQPSLCPACARPACVWPLTRNPGCSPRQGKSRQHGKGRFGVLGRFFRPCKYGRKGSC